MFDNALRKRKKANAALLSVLIWALLLLYFLVAAGLLSGVLPRGWRAAGLPVLTLIAWGTAILHAVASLGGWAAALFFGISFAVSLGMETLGVRTGLVYGAYHYTPKLGFRVFGLVPVLIPLAWFVMVYPGWAMARRIVPKRGALRKAAVGAVGAFAVTAWDLALDPFMVKRGYWVWENGGGFFGVPLHNFAGWWLTVFLVLALFEALGEWKPCRPNAFSLQPVVLYAVMGFTTVWAALQNGLGGPALAGAFAMLPWALWGWASAREGDEA